MSRYPASAYVRVRVDVPESTPRRSPLFTGYRAAVWWGELDGDLRLMHDAVVLFEDTEAVGRGESAMARVEPVDPNRWGDVGPGAELSLCEGERVVARLHVVELFPDP
ncbi:MAG: hypothetical protein WBF71_05535 [Microthrixaceae bacterium]